MSPSTGTTATTRPPTYADLGLRPVINCMGTYTRLTGSRALPQVAEAMALAGDAYVPLDELMDAAGRRLAELTGAGWALVTCGAAAALAQITAAALAGADPEKMARLPDTTGMKHEVVIQAAHRNAFDRSLRMTGARLIEVITRADLEAALGEGTALVAITGDFEASDTIPVNEMIAAARQRGIPTLVDAAAQRPDVPNRYLAMGADAVVYSGGKCLRGPQASGLALGRRDLLWAAYLHGAPHHALGRPMKVGKEEIMGLLAAVEAWLLGRDHDAEWRDWEGYLARIRCAAESLPTVRTRIEPPGVCNVAPTLVISWDASAMGLTPAQAHAALWQGDPRIATHLLPDEGLRIMPYMMEAGEDEIVARRLARVLSTATAPAPTPEPQEPPVDVAGAWTFHLRYALGEATHSAHIIQHGTCLSGTYATPYARVPLHGTVRGTEVEWRVNLGDEASPTPYVYSGHLDNGGATSDGAMNGAAMSGVVALGEFGRADWTARRVD
jgi:L-seryl-tRNA(Ser) seleniumtransferase